MTIVVTDAETREKAARVYAQLRAQYGEPHWTGRANPVGELIGAILSQHTSDANTDRAYANLLATFGDWEGVRDAPIGAIARAIKTAGLSNVKAPRIKAVLQTIMARQGRLSLEHLKDVPLAEAKEELRSLPGVGPKTAACALLFGLGLPAMPVDTHVYRVSRRLGLYPENATVEAAHDLLEEMTPPSDVFGFHVLTIKHGRLVCRAQRPRCPDCILLPHCDYGRRALALLP
ncbi:MAG: endonuclease III [Dehalococcoidales bacterium]|nr:endonuclease III [Dehalococcoidales bacterium]